jgi:hypothetical protein
MTETELQVAFISRATSVSAVIDHQGNWETACFARFDAGIYRPRNTDIYSRMT